jgi:hypothetical protein
MSRYLLRIVAATLFLAPLVWLGSRTEWASPEAPTSAIVIADRASKAEALGHVATAIQERLAQEGGCTVDPRTGIAIGSVDAFAVSLAGYEMQFTAPPSSKDIAAYLQRHEILFSRSKSIFVGAWRDRSSGRHYLDLTEIIADRATALARGRANQQRCIYHLGKRQEVFLVSEAK